MGPGKAELRTSYPARAHETIECYLAIAQTYSQICVDVLFDRSSSRSMSGDLVLEGGRWVLYYVFHTQADALHREGNPPGRGGAALVVAREPQVQLAGDYWTERDTHGTVRTLGHTAKVYTTFEAARAAAYPPVWAGTDLARATSVRPTHCPPTSSDQRKRWCVVLSWAGSTGCADPLGIRDRLPRRMPDGEHFR